MPARVMRFRVTVPKVKHLLRFGLGSFYGSPSDLGPSGATTLGSYHWPVPLGEFYAISRAPLPTPAGTDLRGRGMGSFYRTSAAPLPVDVRTNLRGLGAFGRRRLVRVRVRSRAARFGLGQIYVDSSTTGYGAPGGYAGPPAPSEDTGASFSNLAPQIPVDTSGDILAVGAVSPAAVQQVLQPPAPVAGSSFFGPPTGYTASSPPGAPPSSPSWFSGTTSLFGTTFSNSTLAVGGVLLAALAMLAGGKKRR
ncbi:MAG TPA: hypothetical protein VGR84_19140 [Candidatus Acidoferrales bacterium]|nr:hypothetical protein [Candidatus Acidoferrales bacterium]